MYGDDLQPTYAQNREAWAEYFSSQLTGHNVDSHKREFEEACKIMDGMAEELLEGYQLKHRVTFKHNINR